MNSKELMEKAVKCMDSKKAIDIKVLDISKVTTMADYFVICQGGSSTQMKAIADEIDENSLYCNWYLYAEDKEENELGIRCIATALTDYSKKARYAFSISAPISRMSDERVQELAKWVRKTREMIEREM